MEDSDQSSPSEQVHFIGPHRSFEFYLMMTNTWVWVGLGFLVWPFLASWLAGFKQLAVLEQYTFALPAYLIGSVAIGGGLYMAHYASTSFVIRSSNLFIEHGVFNKVSNTVPLRFIIDCDSSASPAEQSMRVKTLILRVLDGGSRTIVLRLRFIANAEAVRDFILGNSATAQSKVFTSF